MCSKYRVFVICHCHFLWLRQVWGERRLALSARIADACAKPGVSYDSCYFEDKGAACTLRRVELPATSSILNGFNVLPRHGTVCGAGAAAARLVYQH